MWNEECEKATFHDGKVRDAARLLSFLPFLSFHIRKIRCQPAVFATDKNSNEMRVSTASNSFQIPVIFEKNCYSVLLLINIFIREFLIIENIHD